MNMQARHQPAVRVATQDDVPFLARMDHEASLPPFRQSFWDDLLEPTGTDTLTFLQAMLREGASNWGQVSDFIILELDGQPVATCAVFRPSKNPSSPGPLDTDKLDKVAWALSWSNETTKAFRTVYDAIWQGDTSFLRPQAELIIETVAVEPGYRGKGLGDALMNAAFDRGRELNAETIGIMVIHGNDAAQALYEKHFEPWAAFHAAYFNDQFPGLNKFRASLKEKGNTDGTR